jgi:hypothetical protein
VAVTLLAHSPPQPAHHNTQQQIRISHPRDLRVLLVQLSGAHAAYQVPYSTQFELQ